MNACSFGLRVALGALGLVLCTLGMAQKSDAKSRGIDPTVLARANAGEPAAEYQVGWQFEHPDAVWGAGFTESGSSPHDYPQAALWYRKAAQEGYSAAQYNLGLLYLFGNGVALDYTEGIKWFRKAAEQGYTIAQTDLGGFYLAGKYVPQDFVQAALWYRKAAELGNPDGQAILASLYEKGQGVVQDYQEAYFWMNLAAANPELAGVYSFLAKEHVDERDHIASHLTKAEVQATQERTRRWLVDHPYKGAPRDQ